MTALDEIRAEGLALLAVATPGPWYWGGYTDRNAVELVSGASMRPTVIGNLRSLPCLIDDQHWQLVATKDACDECKARLARYEDGGNADDFDDGYECPRNDLPGLAFRDDHLIMHPAAKWARKEVTYRNDVVAVDHPDAALIVWLRNNAGALLGENPA